MQAAGDAWAKLAMQLKRFLRAVVRRLPLVNKYELRRLDRTFNGREAFRRTRDVRPRDTRGLTRVHYACGKNFLPGWLNVDSYRLGNTAEAFECINLVSRHPFLDDSFEFGYAEDFLEHLNQVDSLLFLSECLRTLKPGGVLRLAFPGLEGVLRKHYPDPGWETVNIAKEEAYTHFDHLHFYSKDELALVARHLGFKAVTFHAFGESRHAPLHAIDHRVGQKDLNTYAELQK